MSAAPVRLQKYLASCGVGSRRKCETLITAGQVTVNDAVVTELGTRVVPGADLVVVNGARVFPLAPVYYVVNKPAGLICSCAVSQGPTIIDYLHRKGVAKRVFPVGRLDRDSEGLLLVTNDGELANRLIHPRAGLTKIYAVTLGRPLEEADRVRLAAGIELDDGPTGPVKVVQSKADKNRVLVTLHSGRNRVIRRMFEAVGYRVAKLQRIRLGGLTLGELKPGEFRPISRTLLLKLIGLPETPAPDEGGDDGSETESAPAAAAAD